MTPFLLLAGVFHAAGLLAGVLPAAGLLAGVLSLSGPGPADPRAAYDVLAYRLDLEVEPATKTLGGTVGIECVVVADTLDALVLDLHDSLKVSAARRVVAPLEPRSSLAGPALAVERAGRRLTLRLDAPLAKGAGLRVAIDYSGKPGAKDGFEGVHWKTTAAGAPWFSVACQGVGSSWWWPGKDSFWHPEDKPERTWVNATVPKGLYAVSNGRLAGRDVRGAKETFHWVHGYPCLTYAITLDVAPYVVVEKELPIAGSKEKLDFVYYVLPENAAKAKLQFAEVPEMLAIFEEAFGPFPFPKSKYALVETAFWGMEHSTAIAYGSSYPAWCAENGVTDRYAGMNQGFDYILVHESAHEWWGNAVSAKSWGHFWIHEGFASYAEAVYLERKNGRAAADAYFDRTRDSIPGTARLYRGADVDSGAAYAVSMYNQGAWVLNTLRHCVGDDEAWWKTLRDFNLEFRYRNADTEDFRAVLERNTKKNWKPFFEEFVYGTGHPELTGTVRAFDRGIDVAIENKGSHTTTFHVPVDLAWKAGAESGTRRIWLDPGKNEHRIELKARPRQVVLVGPARIVGHHEVSVE